MEANMEMEKRHEDAKRVLSAWAGLEPSERGYVLGHILNGERSTFAELESVEVDIKSVNDTVATRGALVCHEAYVEDMDARRQRLARLLDVMTMAKVVLAAASELGNLFAAQADAAKEAAEEEAALSAAAAEKLKAREALVGKWGYYDEKASCAYGLFESKDAAMLAAIERVGFSLVRDKLADCPELTRLSFEQVSVIRPEDHTPDISDVLDTIGVRATDEISMDDDPGIAVIDRELASAELNALMKRWCDRHVVVEDPEWYVTTEGERITEDDIARLAKPSERQMELPHTKVP